MQNVPIGKQEEVLVKGHLDNIFQVGEKLFLIVGWSTDQSTSASLDILNATKHERNYLLGNDRICRPDVAIDLEINNNVNHDYGFIVCIETSENERQEKVKIGEYEFEWESINLQNEAFTKASSLLVDSCEWMRTPPVRLPKLLNGELGVGIQHLFKEKAKKLQYQLAREPNEDNSKISAIVCLSGDRDFASLQLRRLSRYQAIETGAVKVIVAVDGRPNSLNDGISLNKWLQENKSLFGYSFRIWPIKPDSMSWSQLLLDIVNYHKSEWFVLIDSQTIASEGDWITPLINTIRSDSYQSKAVMPSIQDYMNMPQSKGALLVERYRLKEEKGDWAKIARDSVRLITPKLMRLVNGSVPPSIQPTKKSWLRFINYWLMQSK